MNERLERDAALASLQAIRDVLDRTSRYTQISSAGIVLGGLTAIAAGAAGGALAVETPLAFLLLWSSAFLIALLLGAATSAQKAKHSGDAIWNRKLQFVILRFLPPLLLGCVLTAVLVHADRLDLAPAIWLGLYGAGVLAASIVLDWEFHLTGWSFLAASSCSYFLLASSPHAALALGFGAIHVALGSYRLAKEYQWRRRRRSRSFRS